MKKKRAAPKIKVIPLDGKSNKEKCSNNSKWPGFMSFMPAKNGNGRKLPRLLADENLGPGILETFRKAGFDIVRVVDAGLQRAPDERIFHFAVRAERIILTLDKGFARGSLFAQPRSTGVVLLPVKANKREPEAEELRKAIADHIKKTLSPHMQDWAGISVHYNAHGGGTLQNRHANRPQQTDVVYAFMFAPASNRLA